MLTLVSGKQLVRHTHFVLAVRNQIKLTTEFELHKRPSGANNAIHPVKWGRR